MNKMFSTLAKLSRAVSALAVVSAGCLMLTSFSPSLDGRAVVVDEGVMPSGLFAKTVGYLPGDVISVSNVAQNKTVDLLVIGALDASEGVAILLTPEAADACGIEKDSNSIVKITKRNGQEDRVYGNAVISGDSTVAAKEDTDAVENPSADAVAEEVFPEEEMKTECGPSLADTERTESEPSEEVAVAPVEETPLIEKAEDDSEAQKRAEERAETPVVAEVPAVEEAAETPEEAPFEEEFTEDYVAALPMEEDEVTDVEEVYTPSPALAETPAPLPPVDEDDDSESYDAIVLVPAGANPPVNDKPYSEPKAEPVRTPVVPKPVVAKADLTYQNFMVSCADDLKRNSYYVQIATMHDDANIQEVVNKYGTNYPITIVPVKNNSKQILIGSLNMDEYAVVLERFKSYGYKDAFLRKIR